MRTFCLKFPDKATAHFHLYGQEGESRYDNVADYNRAGIPTKLATDVNGNQFTTWSEDGSYCADIACVELPVELEPFVIPTPEYRKHKFSGEE